MVGDPESQYEAAVALTNFKGVRHIDSNWKEAVMWLRKAAESGHMSSKILLAVYLYEGVDGLIERDIEKAVSELKELTREIPAVVSFDPYTLALVCLFEYYMQKTEDGKERDLEEARGVLSNIWVRIDKIKKVYFNLRYEESRKKEFEILQRVLAVDCGRLSDLSCLVSWNLCSLCLNFSPFSYFIFGLSRLLLLLRLSYPFPYYHPINRISCPVLTSLTYLVFIFLGSDFST